MGESIEIPVLYKNEMHIFTAHILAYGYTYKLSVNVDGTEIQFEPDEEGGYRAVLISAEADGTKKPDKELIRAISDTLASGRGA
jgi:hypothetical protein